MIKIKLSGCVPAIVEAMLPRGSGQDKALRITLDLLDTDYEAKKNTHTLCRFIFHRPSNYTKVLVNYKFGVNDLCVNHASKGMRYEQHSNHDSCWKSDGMCVLNKHWDNVQKFFDKHPTEVENFYSFSIFEPIALVKLKTFDAIYDDGCATAYDITYLKGGSNDKIDGS